MLKAPLQITQLPSRYEPLVQTFGERAQFSFVEPLEDSDFLKRMILSVRSSAQGKILFLQAKSGAGKSTTVHSLPTHFPDYISTVVRLPLPHQLKIDEIPTYVAEVPVADKITVINFDGREAPSFDSKKYQTFLGDLNGVLRFRPDILIVWPVAEHDFAQKLITLLQTVGGNSAFGIQPLYELKGISQSRFRVVLEKILQIANWKLEDAAIADIEIDKLIAKNTRVGVFLDDLQKLILQRFNVADIGTTFPNLVIAISSGEPRHREIMRSLRRADSYYLEASRLLMYTPSSNVAEWWKNRSTDLRSALPHVIALFNAQLVSVSASAVVHSILQSQDSNLKSLVKDVRSDIGNAQRVMQSGELFKFLMGQATDNREYGSNVKPETFDSFQRIQAQSETRHRAINEALLMLAGKSGAPMHNLKLETSLVPGLQTDATIEEAGITTAIEVHHKSKAESTANKFAIYILEKLKEYAINYKLATR